MRNSTILASMVGMLVVAGCADSPVAPANHTVDVLLTAGGPAFVEGEQQPTADLSRLFTWAILPAGAGQNLAQTFASSENQWLGYVWLPVGCTAGTLLNVRVRDGLGGAILYDVNVAGLPQVADGTFSLIQLYDPAVSRWGLKLFKNRTYAFELAAVAGPSSTGSATCGIVPGPAGSSYGNGRGYYVDATVGVTSWVPLPNGQSTDDEDLPFITLVR